MADKRPNVFPTGATPKDDEPKYQPVQVDGHYEATRAIVANEIYTKSIEETKMDAIDEMRKRTEEQIRLRNAQLEMNKAQTDNYNVQMESAQQRPIHKPEPKVISQPKQQVNTLGVSNIEMKQSNSYIDAISQPQFNMSYDLIPLPSGGKLYRNKKPSVKVAYMTTADENILTSPNLLESGEFLEILINRKLLEQDLRYKDLHVGDRNAIMIWLRASTYGEMYPVTLFDNDDNPFDTEIDLNLLKIKELGAEPDSEGLFDFHLPLANAYIKFKLLTVGDLDAVERLVQADKENEVPVNNMATYILEKQIIDVNGERNKLFIKDFIQTLRIPDAKKLRDYINKIESGVNLELEVGTPGGGSIKTFLPLNFSFFWPDITI